MKIELNIPRTVCPTCENNLKLYIARIRKDQATVTFDTCCGNDLVKRLDGNFVIGDEE